MRPIRKRGSTYHIVRHVPVRFRSVEPRKEVWISLHTDSESAARDKATRVWAKQLDAWEARLAGDTSDAEKAFAAAQSLAQARGFRWMTAGDVAKLPVDALLDRVAAATKASGEPDKVAAVATLGGAKVPPITVKRALELFWELAADDTRGMSENQIRKWRNPRVKAIANFVKVVGNKVLADITRDDMLNFRDWWQKRLVKEGLSAGSANKDVGYVEAILRRVTEMKRLGLVLPFGGMTFKEDDKKTRLPFSEGWIRTRLLAPDALDGLNEQARDLFFALVNTGARPSEIAGLQADHIKLDAPVPHIVIAADGKKVKTATSKRAIPLVGVSLEAMKRHPEGFPRYRFKDAFSATANKYLRENGLLESPQHTLYGLRHAFEDRMLRAKIDERIRRDIMGHSLGGRQRYGEGATLAEKRKLLKKIAL